MLLFNKPKRPRQPDPIDLHLPRSWNALSVDQLERICRLLISTADYDRAHPDAPTTRTTFLVRAFMEIADLEPAPATVPEASPEGQDSSASASPNPSSLAILQGSSLDPDPDALFFDPSFLAQSFDFQFRDERRRKEQQTFEGKIRPICITIGEIMFLASGYDEPTIDPDTRKPRHVDGQIEWLLRPSRLTNFPYPEYKVGDKVYHGPAPMMADVSWRQYRFASNILSELIKGENMLLRLQQKQAPDSPQVIAVTSQLRQARAQWLANIFTLPVTHIDNETQQTVTDYFYVSDQYQRYASDFLDFPDYKYQAISLWWQGMMEHLSRVYPKVFSRDAPDKNARPTDALTAYTRSTATMMKYIGGTEQEVNNTQYTIILQHIQDMADENDRVREISHKK